MNEGQNIDHRLPETTTVDPVTEKQTLLPASELIPKMKRRIDAVTAVLFPEGLGTVPQELPNNSTLENVLVDLRAAYNYEWFALVDLGEEELKIMKNTQHHLEKMAEVVRKELMHGLKEKKFDQAPNTTLDDDPTRNKSNQHALLNEINSHMVELARDISKVVAREEI